MTRSWSILLLFTLSWAVVSAGIVDAAEPPVVVRHATPQEAFEAFRAAALKKDWTTALRSCATRLQDRLLVSNVWIGYQIADNVPEQKAGFEAVLLRHVPQLETWKQQWREKAKAAGREPQVSDLAQRMCEQVADKPALLADLIGWLSKLGIGHGLEDGAVVEAQLRNLVVTGNTGKALAVTGDDEESIEFPLEFIREADGWRLMFP